MQAAGWHGRRDFQERGLQATQNEFPWAVSPQSFRPAKGLVSTGICLILLSGFCCISESTLHAQEKNAEGHQSPRATVRTLLVGVPLAKGAPKLIKEAVSCLDLSALPADQRDTGGLLANQLEAVLRDMDVDTNSIPDKIDDAVYVIPNSSGHRIALRRMPDGRWLFDRETVAQIPKLYLETQKHRESRNKEAASLSVSPEHASARATARTFIEGHRRQDSRRLLRCLDLSEIPSVAREEVGRQLANKLKQIILRYRLPILQEYPNSNYSDPYVLLSQPEGVIELVRLDSGPRKGEWVYSRDTVRSIDKLYVAFEDKPYLDEILALGTTRHLPHIRGETELWVRSHLPAWLRAGLLRTQYITLEVYELIGYILVPLLAFGLYRLSTWVLTFGLSRMLVRGGWHLPGETIANRVRPLGRLIGVLFLRWGLLVLEPDRAILVALLMILNPLVWILGMWACFRLLDLITELMEAHLIAKNRRPEITQMVWPVASLAIKIFLFVITMFKLMTLFDWDLTAVLTGLGIGGLAFALGAQDSLKNLFGSFTLIADRPFVVGESVKIGNHEVGVVEVVGLRSTRIRTTDDTLLIVPNSNLTVMEITNYGRRRYRRYLTRIGVAYSTSLDQLAAFRKGIQDLIRKQENTRKDHFEVAVNDLAASAIEILVNVYFEVKDRHQELAARDALILDLLRLATELKIELAYQTQTIHVVPPPMPAGQAPTLPAGKPAVAPGLL
jgi:MscS family membrane protein